MTDQEYSQAAASFASALSQFAERAERLAKPPLKVPEISEQSDDAEKRGALRRMLDSLASADDRAALSADDILRAAGFFARLYGGEEPYRHRYADVCELVFEKLEQAGDDLDDGVPYSINCLAENVRIIHAQLVEQGHGDQARSVLKLADHIDLEKTRASRDIEQRQIMRDFRKAIESVKDERVEAQRERAELERESSMSASTRRGWSTSRSSACSRRSCSPSTEGWGSRPRRWAQSASEAECAPSCS